MSVKHGLCCLGCVVFLALAPSSAMAAYECTPSEFGGNYYFDCDEYTTYIIFGHLWEGDADRGVGVCTFTVLYPGFLNAKGDFKYRYYDDDSTRTNYEIYAGSGNDVVRLAQASESCGEGWTIRRTLWDNDVTYAFHGDVGNDVIELCSGCIVTSADCLANDGSAEGGTGADVVCGTAHDDDALFGGDGEDVIYGNGGDDYLVGNAQDDDLYGGEGCDAVDGSGGTDFCSCGSSGQEGGYDSNCEGLVQRCFDDC